jgi:hypothetical protein
MRHIFHDHALVRLGTDVFLAVMDWSSRLEAFKRWLAEVHPTAQIGITEFDYLTFGSLAEIVFDHYDVILRVRFPSETVAQKFETRWPPTGPVARPFAALWPDPGPVPRRYDPYEPHFRRRKAEWDAKRAARGAIPESGETGQDPLSRL